MAVYIQVTLFGGTGKKSRKRYRKNLVPKKSTGIGIENIWYRKKVSVSVAFNILGTVTHPIL